MERYGKFLIYAGVFHGICRGMGLYIEYVVVILHCWSGYSVKSKYQGKLADSYASRESRPVVNAKEYHYTRKEKPSQMHEYVPARVLASLFYHIYQIILIQDGRHGSTLPNAFPVLGGISAKLCPPSDMRSSSPRSDQTTQNILEAGP